jgi:hypothetical protein
MNTNNAIPGIEVKSVSSRGIDVLDMAYINSLPQPFLARERGGWEWEVHDIEVETGLVRINVCGLLSVRQISDFIGFQDINGVLHPAEGFYIDANAEEREPINKTKGQTS